MRSFSNSSAVRRVCLMAALVSALLAGCGGGDDGGGAGATAPVAPGAAGTPGAASVDPTVGSASPANTATNVPTSTTGTVGGVNNVTTGTRLSATFTQAMNPATIVSSPAGTLLTFTVKETVSGINVPGTVAMNAASTIATFTPTAASLSANTQYTATISTAAKSAGGTAMPSLLVWKFTTNTTPLTVQAPINLGSAENFVILTKAGITNVPLSVITGNIGTSPITAAALNTFTCAQVAPSSIYGVDAAYTGADANTSCFKGTAPDKTLVDTAVSDMQTAMVEASGRTAGVGPFLNLGGGTVTAQTLAPGVYTWGVPVTITGDITLSGTATDVWIFQLASTLTTDKKIILAGTALAKNVFWRTAGNVQLQATADFTGVILGDVTVALITGATVKGRLYSKTDTTLQQNTITQPAP